MHREIRRKTHKSSEQTQKFGEQTQKSGEETTEFSEQQRKSMIPQKLGLFGELRRFRLSQKSHAESSHNSAAKSRIKDETEA